MENAGVSGPCSALLYSIKAMSALAWLDAVQLEKIISDSCVNASSRIHYHDCMAGELEMEVMVPLTRCTCASVHAPGILDTDHTVP